VGVRHGGHAALWNDLLTRLSFEEDHVPRKKLPMRKITEVLRLRAAGMTNRDIAASTGVGKTTVYEYLARAEAAGLGWPLPDELDEQGLEVLLFPSPSAELTARRPVPDWRQVHRELKGKGHLTLRLLWLEWREVNLVRITELPRCRSPKFPRS